MLGLFQKRRFEEYILGGDFFQSKEQEKVGRKNRLGNVKGGLAKQGAAHIAIDMIRGQSHIHLSEVVNGGPFGNNPSEELVVVLTLSLLVGPVWLTEEHHGTLPAEEGAFHPPDVREFMAVVCKDQRKTRGEKFLAKSVLKDVKHADNRRGIVVIQNKVELHVERDKVEAKDSGFIGREAFDAVHLDGGNIVVLQETQVVRKEMPIFGGGRDRPGFRRLPGLALNGFGQVNGAGVQLTGMEKTAEGGFADCQGIRVRPDDMVNRLAPPDQGRDQGIDFLELSGGKVEAIAGVDKRIPVLLVGVLSKIEAPFKMAKVLFVAGITEMERVRAKGIAQALNVVGTVFLCLGAGLAFFLAGRGPADMVPGAGRGMDAVTAFGDKGRRMLPDLPRDGRGGLVQS